MEWLSSKRTHRLDTISRRSFNQWLTPRNPSASVINVVDKSQLYFNELLASVIQKMTPMAEDKKVNIQLNMGDVSFYVLGDEARLAHAIQNVLHNFSTISHVLFTMQ